jgi:hypothetical protein
MMGYFSSGTEGMDYEARYCERCANFRKTDADVESCPILELHMMWNYDSCDDETKREALNAFIPMTKDGVFNEACRMFLEEK